MNAVEKLHKILSKTKAQDRPHLLRGIYKQVATSHEGEKANGEFRDYLNLANGRKKYELISSLSDQLDKHGLADHAKRLRLEYMGIRVNANNEVLNACAREGMTPEESVVQVYIDQITHRGSLGEKCWQLDEGETSDEALAHFDDYVKALERTGGISFMPKVPISIHRKLLVELINDGEFRSRSLDTYTQRVLPQLQ